MNKARFTELLDENNTLKKEIFKKKIDKFAETHNIKNQTPCDKIVTIGCYFEETYGKLIDAISDKLDLMNQRGIIEIQEMNK